MPPVVQCWDVGLSNVKFTRAILLHCKSQFRHWTTQHPNIGQPQKPPSSASRAAILTDSYRLSNVKFTRAILLHCKSQFRHWTTRHPNIGQPQKPPLAPVE